MVFNYRITLFVILVGCIAVGGNCMKDCIKQEYSFNIPLIAYPNLDSIRIGDTVWLDISTPTSLTDQLSGNTIHFTNATNLTFPIAFQEVLSATNFRPAVTDFNFKVEIGKEGGNTNPALFKEYFLTEINGLYKLKVGFIAKTLGVYRFSVESAAYVHRNNSNCEKAFIRVNFMNTAQHFYLYPGGAGTPPGGGTYYFKVY